MNKLVIVLATVLAAFLVLPDPRHPNMLEEPTQPHVEQENPQPEMVRVKDPPVATGSWKLEARTFADTNKNSNETATVAPEVPTAVPESLIVGFGLIILLCLLILLTSERGAPARPAWSGTFPFLRRCHGTGRDDFNFDSVYEAAIPDRGENKVE